MYYVALAADYDGTLAHNGRVDRDTIAALERLKASGRKLILVTGRLLPDLATIFPGLEMFDLIVAENGGLLFDPVRKQETPLAEPPPPTFVARLHERGVSPLSTGKTIVSTWVPHERTVLDTIREFGLELHIVFNKGAVMILPGRVNKASGLKAALRQLGLSPHNVAGIGDAENDLDFLGICGKAFAVENALPSVKQKADLEVASHGAGVIELAGMLLENDLAGVEGKEARKEQLILGTRADKSAISLTPFDTVLITGTSGSGKSTAVTALLEQMASREFQFCVIDPEGDYGQLRDAVGAGSPKSEPSISQVMDLLAKPAVSVAVNLIAIDPPERPRFLARLLPELARLRAETGRPHWIVIDEVHHCLPAGWAPAPVTLPKELPAAIAVTVHPEEVAPAFLDLVSVAGATGSGAADAIRRFCEIVHREAPPAGLSGPPSGGMLLWKPGEPVEVITAARPEYKRKRHLRKYAEGELGNDRSFYFRGPEGALNLRAQNLSMFLQLADGVDDRTWLHHLSAAEYSRWFEDAVKDDDMAHEAHAVEQDRTLTPRESRARIREMVERRYTAPAK